MRALLRARTPGEDARAPSGGFFDAQLHPCAAASAGFVAGTLSFSDHGFEAQPSDLFNEELRFAVQGGAKKNCRIEGEAAQAFLALFNWFASHVATVDVQKVEGVKAQRRFGTGMTIHRDDLTVDHGTVRGQLAEGLAGLRVIQRLALARKQSDFRAVLDGDHAAAIAFDFIEPAPRRGQFLYILAKHRLHKRRQNRAAPFYWSWPRHAGLYNASFARTRKCANSANFSWFA